MTIIESQAVSVQRFEFFAERAAQFLFRLRDGTDGELYNFKLQKKNRKPTFEIKSSKPVPLSKLRPTIDAMQVLNNKFEREGWAIRLPVFRSPDLWNDLKQASSEQQIRALAAKIVQWDQQQGLGYTPNPCSSQHTEYDFPRVLSLHARTIVEAKQLPEYPKKESEKNDDKRLKFFAKILAGLMLERSPLYTLKRLSRWRPARFRAVSPRSKVKR